MRPSKARLLEWMAGSLDAVSRHAGREASELGRDFEGAADVREVHIHLFALHERGQPTARSGDPLFVHFPFAGANGSGSLEPFSGLAVRRDALRPALARRPAAHKLSTFG